MSQHGMRPFALAPSDGKRVENPTGGVTTFKAVSHQSGGGLTVIEGVSAPGEGPPLHVHREQDEFIYTLDGTFRVRLGDDLIEALPGSFVFIPRNTSHTWQNIGDGLARFVATLISGERRVRGVLPALRRPASGGARSRGVRPSRGGNGSDGGIGSAARAVTPALILSRAVTRWTPRRAESIMASTAIAPTKRAL